MKARGARSTGLLGRLRGRDHAEREVTKSEEEWRAQLTPEQFRVLRRRGTEAPFTGDAVVPDAEGVFRCGACDASLFPADAKFESGTGWPSFTETVPDGVELRRDYKLGIPRTEVVCRSCGGHLGHVFNDGPGPGRKRYCINGCSLAQAREAGHSHRTGGPQASADDNRRSPSGPPRPHPGLQRLRNAARGPTFTVEVRPGASAARLRIEELQHAVGGTRHHHTSRRLVDGHVVGLADGGPASIGDQLGPVDPVERNWFVPVRVTYRRRRGASTAKP